TVSSVSVLTGIFFNVHFVNTDSLLLTTNFNFDVTITSKWLEELCNLVSLWVIRIEVVLTVEVSSWQNVSVGCDGNHDSQTVNVLVNHWQSTRHSPINYISLRVLFSTLGYW